MWSLLPKCQCEVTSECQCDVVRGVLPESEWCSASMLITLSALVLAMASSVDCFRLLLFVVVATVLFCLVLSLKEMLRVKQPA